MPEDTEAKWERLRNTNIFDLSPEDRAALAAYQANHLRHELREYMTVLAEKVILPGFDALKTTFLSAFATTGEVARRDKLITAMRLIVVTDPPFLSDGWCLNRFLTYQKHKYPVSCVNWRAIQGGDHPSLREGEGYRRGRYGVLRRESG